MNSTAPEVSTNSTTSAFYQISNLEICMFCINLLFGLPTHSYVIWLIVTGTRNGVALAFFNLNHSVCEIGTCLDCLFLVLSNWISNFSAFAMFLQGLALTGRALFQCLICVERYLAVVHPVTFLKCKPLRYRVICCTVAWMISLGSCLVCMITLMLYNIKAHALLFSLQFLFLLSIQLFCLVAVLRALKRSGPGERVRERVEENHMKRRAFLIILITTVNMVIVYVPITISGLCIFLTKEYIAAFWYLGLICYVLAPDMYVMYLHQSGKLPCLCSP